MQESSSLERNRAERLTELGNSHDMKIEQQQKGIDHREMDGKIKRRPLTPYSVGKDHLYLMKIAFTALCTAVFESAIAS